MSGAMVAAEPAARAPASGAVKMYDRVQDPLAFAEQMAVPAASMMGADPNQGKAIALHCLCEGLTLLEMRRRYHWVSGKPSMRSDAMLAEFRLNHGGAYRIIERSPQRAAIELTDRDGNSAEFELTIEELLASRWPWVKWDAPEGERKLKDNYATPTDQKAMLWVRLISDSLRAFCPELVAGVYTPEEIEDGYREEAPQQRPTTAELLGAGPPSGDAPIDVATTVETRVVDDPLAEPADAAAEGPDAPGSITMAQKGAIEKLFASLGVSPEKQAEILLKRGANVVRNLSKNDAQGIADRLVAIQREREAEAGN